MQDNKTLIGNTNFSFSLGLGKHATCDCIFKKQKMKEIFNTMGKKHRNRINSPKKNNHIPKEAIIAEHEAHGKEMSAKERKN